jgi:hypothetical protein
MQLSRCLMSATTSRQILSKVARNMSNSSIASSS